MQFNVAQLLQEPVGSTREYDIDDDFDLDGGPRRLRGRVELLRTDRGILARARLSGTNMAECARCLTPFGREAGIEFEEEYVQTVDVATGAPIREEREPDALMISARHELDLSDAVRQYLVMSEPMLPLCRADCAGLCPICGKNRNVEPHEHEPEDPRWAALEQLREKLGENDGTTPETKVPFRPTGRPS